MVLNVLLLSAYILTKVIFILRILTLVSNLRPSLDLWKSNTSNSKPFRIEMDAPLLWEESEKQCIGLSGHTELQSTFLYKS